MSKPAAPKAHPPAAPSSLEWNELPTFDQLLVQSALKVSALRLRLAAVPRWRCPDNSVRYELEAAEAALAEPPESDAGGPVTVLSMLDKQIAINALSAKHHNDTIKAMGDPLKAGVELWRLAWDRQEKRLAALESTFDRMLAVLEAGHTHQHERELANKKQDATIALRGKTLEVVKQQLPAIVDKWSLTRQAKLAVDLVQSLDPRMISTLIDSGILDEKQTAALQQLRASMPKPGAVAAAASSQKPPSEDN